MLALDTVDVYSNNKNVSIEFFFLLSCFHLLLVQGSVSIVSVAAAAAAAAVAAAAVAAVAAAAAGYVFVERAIFKAKRMFPF